MDMLTFSEICRKNSQLSSPIWVRIFARHSQASILFLGDIMTGLPLQHQRPKDSHILSSTYNLKSRMLNLTDSLTVFPSENATGKMCKSVTRNISTSDKSARIKLNQWSDVLRTSATSPKSAKLVTNPECISWKNFVKSFWKTWEPKTRKKQAFHEHYT